MIKLPEAILDCLSQWYAFPECKFDCQVSTFSNQSPHIRTMLLYNIKESGELIFLTRTDTLKWHDLKECPQIAICIFHPSYGQIIMEGTGTLNNMINYSEEITSYWDSLPLQFQKIYLQDVNNKAKSITKIPKNFGVISVKVSMCEILFINKNDYIKSKREQFLILNNSWVKQLVTPV